jgi:hypothetical protein
MNPLFKAELGRFARWALGLGVLHALALLLIDRTFPALRDDGEIAIVAGFVYAVTGAIFGFYQYASYARTSHWIALLHRPLAPWRILAAVSGASAAVLFAAVVVPLLVFTATLDLQVGRVVDARHWWLSLAGGVFALVGLGLGSVLALAPRRYGWTALVAASVLIVGNRGTGPAALWLPLTILAVLALLLAGAFKPDRRLHPVHPGLLAPVAGVAALGLYFLLAGAIGLAYQLGLAAVGRNPELDVPPPGGVVEASRAQGNVLMAGALATIAGEEAATLRVQLRDAAATRLPVAIDHMPVRGELTNAGPIGFTDARTGIAWTYSHDRNAFEGLRLMDRRPAGALAPDGGFAAPPLLLGEGRMIAGGSLYRFDPRSGTLQRLLQLPAGETILARPAAAGPFFAMLGARALYLADRRALEAGRVSAPMVVVPLPGPAGDLQRLDMAVLGDRSLVSFYFGRDSVDGPSRAWQHVVLVAHDGAVRALAQRTVGPDHPAFLRYRAYWLSPALHAIAGAAAEIGAGGTRVPHRAPIDVPRGVWIGAALLSLVAAAATAFLARRRRLPWRDTAAWTLAALALGTPLFAAFRLLLDRPFLIPPTSLER